MSAGSLVKQMNRGRTEDAPGRRFRKDSAGKTFIAHQLVSLYFWAFKGPRSGYDTALPRCSLPHRHSYSARQAVLGAIRKVGDHHFRITDEEK